VLCGLLRLFLCLVDMTLEALTIAKQVLQIHGSVESSKQKCKVAVDRTLG